MSRDLKQQLAALGLRHTADGLDDLIALATKSRWGAVTDRRRTSGEGDRPA